MSNLDTLSVPSRATADYAVSNPENAWPGAGSEVLVWMIMAGEELVQFGCDITGGEIWMRRRSFGGEGGPWQEWTNTAGANPPDAPAP
jgi:hypothetical protein